MSACELYPTIKVDGGRKQSKLAADILKNTGDREHAANVYNRYLGFKDKEHLFDENEIDENGQPKLEALLKTDLISKNPDTAKVACDIISRIAGFSDKNGSIKFRMTRMDRDNALSRVAAFNDSSDFKDKYVAVVVDHYADDDRNPGKWIQNNSDDNVSIEIKPKNVANEREARNQMASMSLNEKIRKQMGAMGIKDEALFDYEERRKLNGITDFSVAKETAHGMSAMIRLAKGGRGEAALPEEFSHLTVRAMEGMPIRDRFVNVIKNNHLADIILGDKAQEYHEYYNEDEGLIAEEAAGQLVQAALIGNEGMEIPEALAPMLTRMMKAIGETYSKGDADNMTTAIYQAVEMANKMSSQIMSFEFIKSLKELKINSNIKMAQIKKETHKLEADLNFQKRTLLQKLQTIHAESSRIDSLTSLGQDVKKSETLKDLDRRRKGAIGQAKHEMDEAIEKNDNALGVQSMIDRIMGDVNSTLQKLDVFTDPEKSALISEQEINHTIHQTKIMTESYQYALNVLHDEIIKKENKFPPEVQDQIQHLIEQTSGQLTTLQQRNNERIMLTAKMMHKEYTKDQVLLFGDTESRAMTATEYLNGIGADEGFYDAILRSAANSNNPIVRMMDDYIKIAYHKARLKTIEDANKIIDLFHEYETRLGNNYDFMYEMDADGNFTGKYISKYDVDRYRKDKDAYMSHVTGDYESESAKFDSTRKPNGKYSDIYITNSFRRLTRDQQSFYDKMMEIKGGLDFQIPAGQTTLENAIKIRKDTFERVFKDKENMASATLESIKDSLMLRADDIEYDTSRIKNTLSGRQVVGLPINFIRTKEGEDMNGISRDLFSTMIAYAGMANNFKYKAEIVDKMEIMRDHLESMQFTRSSSNLLSKSISHFMLQKPDEENKTKLDDTEIETQTGYSYSNSRLKNRIDKLFLMSLYGVYSDKDNVFKVGDKNISINKLGNMLVKQTALSALTLNFCNDVINVTTGSIAMNVEAMGGENFTYMESKRALVEYGKEINALMFNVGHWEKSNKLALINRMFDVMQDYDAEVTDIKYDRKSELGKKLGKASILFGNRAGEHFLQHRTAIACMIHYKMKNADGTEISLYDALKTKPRDPKHPEKGSELVLKDGVTKMDGTKWDQKDLIQMTRKIASINQSMHGIYNKIDRAAAQYYMIGKFAFQFKKYFVPQWDKRFAAAKYNSDLGTDTEGYYMTTLGFLHNLAKESKGLSLDITTQWHKLNDRQRANIHKSISDMAYVIALGITAGCLYNYASRRKNNPWLLKFAEYQAVKLYADHVVFLPGIGITNWKAAFGEPLSVLGTLSDFGKLPEALKYQNWQEPAGGLWEGHSKGLRDFVQATMFMKPWQSLLRFLNPDPSIEYILQNNNTFGAVEKTKETKEIARKVGYEKAKDTRAKNKKKKEEEEQEENEE